MTHFLLFESKKYFFAQNQSFLKLSNQNSRFRFRKEQSYQISMDLSEFSITDRSWTSETFFVFAITEHLLHI